MEKATARRLLVFVLARIVERGEVRPFANLVRSRCRNQMGVNRAIAVHVQVLGTRMDQTFGRS